MTFYPLISPTNGKKIIYLDNAATTPKPKTVLEAYFNYYQNYCANTHSIHQLSKYTSHKVQETRQKVANFVNTKTENVIFTSGATATFNFLADAFCSSSLAKDNTIFDISSKSEILVTVSDHHSNFVPWQQLAKKLGQKFVVANSIENIEQILANINPNTSLVAMPHISNVSGNCFDIYKVQKKCTELKIPLIIDACQSITCQKIRANELNFVVFSSHKMYGPNGVGVLVSEFLNQANPSIFGGDMVETVTKEYTTWADLPHKLEAGTGNFGAIIALGEAVDFVKNNYIDQSKLANYTREELAKISGIRLFGIGKNIISFTIEGIHSLDLAMYLDTKNIAIRTGNHCAQPLLKYLEVSEVCRISLGFQNTLEELEITVLEINKFVNKIRKKLLTKN